MAHPLVKKLDLLPHPEGGYYKQVYRSDDTVSSPKHGLARPSLTHIYFLLLKGQVSRFHRVLHDEVWNHYAGAPLRLFHLHQQQLTEQRLGTEDFEFASVVRAGHYQAAESMGDYTLVGCSVAPGFDFADFSFIEEPSLKQWLEVSHPDMQRFI